MALSHLRSGLSFKALCLTAFLIITLGLSVIVQSHSATDIVYVYDELGRLVAVIDPSGDAAVYRYDAVGNLLSISRYSAATVSVIEFTPNSGAVGTTVTIYGTGFSATPSQNTVAFNGVSAVVTSSTSTQIVTSVPSGATTGPITVTAPAGNASSDTSFVVGDAGAPTITSFSPTIGTAGTAVTITGTNFEPSFQNNKTRFNVSLAANTSATSTTINANVPSATGSGRIKVSTPAGSATSTGDFFIPPAPYTPADVAVTDRMATGDNKTVTINTANKIGIVVFDGNAGDRVGLGMTGVTIGQSNSGTTVSLRDPYGSLVLNPFNVGTDGGATDSITLPVAGTYSIVVDPNDTYTGSMTLLLSADLNIPITIDGSPVNLSFSRVGQNAQLTFSGTAGQRVSVGMGPSTIGFWNWGTFVSAKNPDGSTLLTTMDIGTDGTGSNTLSLPSTGTYSILVDPRNAFTGNILITLSTEVTSSIAIDDPASTLTLRAGQNAKVTFTANGGQQAQLRLTNVTIGAFGNWGSYVSIRNPNGSNLLSPIDVGLDGVETSFLSLSTTGTYSVIIDPRLAYSGNMTIRVVSPPPPPQAVTTPDSNDVVWFDDALPTGASPTSDGDPWSWITSSPTPISGTSAHQSNIVSGAHQHYFDGATATMSVSTGDKLIAYVYLDPNNMPNEVMLQFNDGSWEHRAYWGANNIGWGNNNTNSRRYMGSLPATGGQWLRLVVPASDVGLEGRTVKGMAFTLHGGRATWDRAAKATQ